MNRSCDDTSVPFPSNTINFRVRQQKMSGFPPCSQRTGRSRKSPLPVGFLPSPYSVLIGRGKTCSEAIGNKRLQVIISTFLDEYSRTSSRIEKSVIVNRIVDLVYDACPIGAFIKKENGIWWEVSDRVARERVGVMIRDSLHEQYKSSSKSTVDTFESTGDGVKITFNQPQVVAWISTLVPKCPPE